MTSGYCAGIAGNSAGDNSGSATFIKCFNVGNITGNSCGGIVGEYCCNNGTSCSITDCYNTGSISGSQSGGITGSNLGTNSTSTPVVNITNCYSLGTIDTNCGGIIGGNAGGVYTNPPAITITNTYSSGTYVDVGSGIVASSYTQSTTQTNCYTANGSWSDATANTNLTGTPTSLTSGNPGTTWTTIATNTPYVLSVYNASLYSPSSAGTGAKTYTTSPGLFQSGYNYQIIYSNQVSNVLTTYVFVSKGTGPYYNSYNVNTFTLTAINLAPGSISAGITAATGVLNFVLPDAPCFLEGTKILCFKNNQEIYRPIESLRKGDLVKTIYNGYMPVNMICTSVLYNPGNDHRITNRLYKCSKERYPELFEDLYITGCHSILLPWLTDQQWELTKSVNGNVFVTDNHFRLIAYADELAEPFNKEGYMNIYHVALDHHDEYMNYGIYANGLLVESCSIDCLIYSGMKELGENDSIVVKDMGVNNAGNMTQMVGAC